jgi:hypothetical protein
LSACWPPTRLLVDEELITLRMVADWLRQLAVALGLRYGVQLVMALRRGGRGSRRPPLAAQ